MSRIWQEEAHRQEEAIAAEVPDEAHRQERTVAAEVPEEAQKEIRRAEAGAMQLLLYRQRTEKELRSKLLEKEFSEQAVEAAVRYVSAYGYLDDRRYAEAYLHSRQAKTSRRVIAQELRERGVRNEWIEEVFAEQTADEGETIYAILCKRAGPPHVLEERELRRQVQYLSRKGFSSEDIWRQVRRYRSADVD